MLTEICQYLHNWFDVNQPKYYGKFEIKNGVIESYNDGVLTFLDGQYIRIIGSVLSEGVHLCPLTDVPDEVFEGSVWSMAVPVAIRDIARDVEAWRAKYEAVDSAAMSPYTSESFGGYSYSKSGGGASDGTGGGTWESVFGNRLSHWRKLP